MNRKLERQIERDTGFAKWMLQSFIKTQPSADIENMYVLYKSGLPVERIGTIPQEAPKGSVLQRIKKLFAR